MKKFLTAVVVNFCLLCFCAEATIYVAPSPGYQAGQAIGNLLGTIIAAEQQKKAAKQKQHDLEQLKAALKQIAEQGTAFMKGKMEAGAETEMWDEIEKHIYSVEMGTPQKLAKDDITAVQFQKMLDNNIGFIAQQYSVNKKTKQCRVIVAVAGSANVKEASIVDYTPYEEAPSASPIEALEKQLGVRLSEAENAYKVTEILSGEKESIFMINDMLIKVDMHQLASDNIERIAAFIKMRREQKQPVKISVMRNGETLELELP